MKASTFKIIPNLWHWSWKLLINYRAVIPIVVLSLIFAMFTEFGYELDAFDIIKFFDFILWIRVLLLAFLYFVVNILLFSLIKLANSKNENQTTNSKNFMQNNELKRYVFLFGTAATLVVYTAVFLAAYPGYYTYDTECITKFVETGTMNDFHSPLQNFICAIIMKPVLEISGSWNLAIAVYLFLHMIVFVACVTLINYKLLKYKVPLWLIIIIECYFAFNPIIAMFASCSVKDVTFGIVFVLFTFYLYEIFIYNEKLKLRNMLIVVFMLLILILYRKNFLYALIVFSLIFILGNIKNLKQLIRKKNRSNISLTALNKVVLCTLFFFTIFCGFLIKGPIYDALSIEKTNGFREMISIPAAQISRSLRYDKDLYEALNNNGINSEELLNSYNSSPENSDKFRTLFVKNKDVKIMAVLWLKAVINNPCASLEAVLKITQAAWQPYRLIRAYYNFPIALYNESNTQLFSCWTAPPGELQSKIPDLQNFLFSISRDGVLESNPLLGWICSPAVYLWLLLFTLVYSIFENNKYAILVMLLYFFVVFTYLMGPCVLIRYYLFLIYGFPLFFVFLFRPKLDV